MIYFLIAAVIIYLIYSFRLIFIKFKNLSEEVIQNYLIHQSVLNDTLQQIKSIKKEISRFESKEEATSEKLGSTYKWVRRINKKV